MKKRSSVRRVVSLLLVISMVFLLSFNVLADYFPDVPNTLDDEYKDAINYVSDNGIMQGTNTGNFQPNVNIERAMLITALYQMSGDTGTYNGSSIFSDVPSYAYYNTAVGWAYAHGITTGVSNSQFNPSALVDKAHLVLFLHRYAAYKQYNTTDREGVSGMFDYSAVPTYARDAVSWAYSFAVLKYSDTLLGYIEPLEYVTRADCAVYLCRFIQNVRGFIKETDAFSFNNSGSSFITGSGKKMYLSESDKERIDQIDPDFNGTWNFEGYCFGMCVATLLDFTGKMDLNGNYCNSISTINRIHAPQTLDSTHILTTDYADSSITISEVESKIATCHYSQIVSNIFYDTLPDFNVSRGLHQMVDALKYGGAGVFNFFFGTTEENVQGHTIIAYGKPIETSYGYRINVCDYNRPNYSTWLEIDTNCSENQSPDNTVWSVVYKMQNPNTNTITTSYRTITACTFSNDFSIFSGLDPDGWYNTTDNNRSATQLPSDRAVLEMSITGNFSISNSEGETLEFDRGIVSGTMDVHNYNFLPSAPEAPVRIFLVVDSSDSFTCTQSRANAVLELNIRQEDQRISASKVELSRGNTVSLTMGKATK